MKTEFEVKESRIKWMLLMSIKEISIIKNFFILVYYNFTENRYSWACLFLEISSLNFLEWNFIWKVKWQPSHSNLSYFPFPQNWWVFSKASNKYFHSKLKSAHSDGSAINWKFADKSALFCVFISNFSKSCWTIEYSLGSHRLNVASRGLIKKYPR